MDKVDLRKLPENEIEIPEGGDSLEKRYFFKLGTNLIALPLNLGIQWMATRALGPVGYGSYTFLTAFFNDVISFFDSGTSTGFYAKLCSRPKEACLIAFYWRLTAGLAVFLLTSVFVVSKLGFREKLWPDQGLNYVILAAIYALGLWSLNVAGKIVDAFGLTVAGEKARFGFRIATVTLVAILFFCDQLDLSNFLCGQVALVAFQLWLWQRALKRRGRSLWASVTLGGESYHTYVKEFWDYSHPLIVYAFVGMATGIADRWLLQKFGGGAEQGFYGLSYQVGALCFLFTGAMVPLLAREFSQAHGENDFERLGRDFSTHLPRFYALSALIGVFLATEADRVAVLIGGKDFAAAGWSLCLMCLYPIHQTYGQLTASVFFATGQTRLYRNVGMANMALGLILTLWFLAPRQYGGLNLGSSGLALKMVLAQVIGVNLILWMATRSMHMPYLQFMTHQAAVVLLFGIFGVIARIAVVPVSVPPVGALLMSGTVYVFLAAICILMGPSMIRMTHAELKELVTRVVFWIRGNWMAREF